MKLLGPLAQTARNVAKLIADSGHIAYFAGGCVRDEIMGKTPDDFDIATSATPEQVEALFAKTVPVGRQFGVMLVIENQMTFEVATFRKEGGYVDGRHPTEISFTVPQEDARRRDFTVNGIFYDPLKAQIIDYVGGEEDIRRKMIRAIGDPYERFAEDKLRILRAVRFAATLEFEIEAATWNAVKAMAPQIHEVSPERIREELVKIFTRAGAGRGLDLLLASGLLHEILPEVEALKGVPQPPKFHPEGDVYVHTRGLLERLKSPSVVLALSALFHDVGKPKTYAVKEDGKITFYEHAALGARMARDIMRRLRFSNDEIDDVADCIDNHMAFADVQRMRSGKLKRLVSRPTFQDELELHRIDCEASHGMLQNFEFLLQKQVEFQKENLKPKPLINGHDLQSLGMVPGPAMKPLLDELYDLQLEGTVQTRDQAIEYARKKIPLG